MTRLQRFTRHTGFVATLVLVTLAARPLVAAQHSGLVTFGGLPVPGATVIAAQGERTIATSTDRQGAYVFPDLADGVWTVRVEMLGFTTVTREVIVGASSLTETWELALAPFEEIAARATPQQPAAGAVETLTVAPSAQPARPAAQTNPFQRATPSVAPAAPGAVARPAAAVPDEGNPFANESSSAMAAADGLLINGSVNNGAATPFAQPRSFGNNIPGQRSLYNWMAGSLLGNSAWDARPYSFVDQVGAKPSYQDVQFLGTFGGPLRIPRLFRNAPNVFVGYQRSGDTNATSVSTRVPTELERRGDFSQSHDAFGRPVQILNPATGLPFDGNRLPDGAISTQAAALLRYYPLATVGGSGASNFEAPVISETRQDSIQARWTQTLTTRRSLAATAAYQRTRTTSTSLFGFEDDARLSALDAQATISQRLSQFTSMRWRYQLTMTSNDATPYFSGVTNVSGDAGISGNNQDPENWGPPTLTFASGLAGLSTGQYASTKNLTHAAGFEGFWVRGRHSFTYGGDARRHAIDIESQQNARGTFAFTGASTGSDLADFLLGLPQASSMAFGNADKFLRGWSSAAYLTDDWRLGPSLTLNLGVRWEFESPLTERLGRLVNLDVLPGFSGVAPVLASNPTGALTGNQYPESLLRADLSGIQPRLAAAWRPIPGSSLVVRAGYGVYRNTSVYQPLATLLAQQPPLSTTFSVETTDEAPLTLADGFVTGRSDAFNTFAIDPDFRVGYVHNWQVSAQRDLPASLTVAATYLGSKGSRLMQQFLPNTFPAGAVNPCPACPAGFVYLTSGGSSLRNAGQIQLRRRLRNGFTASIQYTLSKATDNASAFSGGPAGGVIAQDWLELDAEQGPSPFDQRHQIVASAQYTTGAGITGGTLIDGWKGRLFKDWTFTGQLTTGSGSPLTPTYFTSVRGTVGSVRASLTGEDPDARPDGFYLNPAAYAVPAAGEWGNAGRNSMVGPSQFSLNGAVARTFRLGDRLNLDWRVDATNILNRVTYTSVNMLVTSPQFGRPDRTGTMRKLQSSLRLRF